jgi:hypothetical protein
MRAALSARDQPLGSTSVLRFAWQFCVETQEGNPDKQGYEWHPKAVRPKPGKAAKRTCPDFHLVREQVSAGNGKYKPEQ